jgi:hypothetical protein
MNPKMSISQFENFYVHYLMILPEIAPFDKQSITFTHPDGTFFAIQHTQFTLHQEKIPNASWEKFRNLSYFTNGIFCTSTTDKMNLYRKFYDIDDSRVQRDNPSPQHTMVEICTNISTENEFRLLLGLFDAFNTKNENSIEGFFNRQDLEEEIPSLYKCLDVLYNFHRNYANIRDEYYTIPSFTSMFPIVNFVIATKDGQRILDGIGSLGLVNMHRMQENSLHSTSETIDITLREQKNIEEGNPFSVYKSFMYSAHRSLLLHNDTSSAILSAGAACEILIDGLVCLLLWEKRENPQITPELITKILNGTIHEKIQSGLAGIYINRKSKNAYAVKHWLDTFRNLRNAVVHHGYIPTYREAAAAIDAIYPFWGHIEDCFVKRNTIYPIGAAIFVGSDGFAQRDKLMINPYDRNNFAPAPNEIEIQKWASEFTIWMKHHKELARSLYKSKTSHINLSVQNTKKD